MTYINRAKTIVPMAHRVAPEMVENQFLPHHIGINVYIAIASVSGAQTLQVSVDTVDPVSQEASQVLQSAVLNAAGLTVLQIRPNLTAVANLVASAQLGVMFRIRCAHANGTDDIQYGVSVVECV